MMFRLPTFTDMDSSAPDASSTALEAVGLWKSYGHVQALHGASLAVAPGELVALVGDNGAGKSTLMKALAGTIIPDQGEVRIGSHRASSISVREAISLGVQTLYQDLALAPALTVSENVFLGHEIVSKRARLLGHLDRRAMEARTQSAVAKLRVTLPSIDAKVSELSGGQRQIVAVARATLWARTAILLDEPTAALGVRQSEAVVDMIQQAAASGLAVLLVSHDMPRVLAIAHRVAVMRHGRIVADLPASGLTLEEIVSYMVGRGDGSVDHAGRDISGSAGPAGEAAL
jgi:simple sugar transport system ATP-binding protein